MKYKLILMSATLSFLTACCCTSNTPTSDSMPSDFILSGYTQGGTSNTSLGPSEQTTLDDLGASPDGFEITRKSNPIKAKDSDREWASAQPNYGYTIELARSDKPSKVASVLYHAPKAQRMAEIESRNGYVGVYGSYFTHEEAQKAMQNLPSSIQQHAKIKPWSEVR